MRLRQWLIELNLFEMDAVHDQIVKIQRWFTRVYIIALSVVLVILSIHAIVEDIPQHIEIRDPTFKLYNKLQDKYSLDCPCSNVAIPYEQFAQFAPQYHQVCSSDFVTQRWIDYLYNPSTTPFYYPEDFRSTASQQFQLLAILCRLSIQAINDSLHLFNNTKFISAQLLSKNLFRAQIQAHIHAFKTSTLKKFSHTLDFVRNLLYGNTLLSVSQTFYPFQLWQNNGFWSAGIDITFCLYHLNIYCCQCSLYPHCKAYAGFFGDQLLDAHDPDKIYAHLDIVDGWYIGCSPIDSLLYSTLKSFYNQTTIDSFLLFFRNSSDNFTCLNANHPTIFPPNYTTLETIIKASFIEEWNDNIDYVSYFNICAPKLCTYTSDEHILHSISTVLGLYGGLSIILRFLISIIIKLVIWRTHRTSPTEEPSSWLQKLKRALRDFNCFKSAMYDEPHDIYRQRWSTRVYILFLSVTLTIILLHIKLNVQVMQITVTKPSFSDVSNLQKQAFSLSLQCPCSYMSASMKHFVKFNPTYHEVCWNKHNFLVLYEWLIGHFGSTFTTNDFRQAGPIFKVLKSFCELSEITVSNAIHEFNATQLVTENLLTLELFTSRMNSSVTYLISGTSNRFFDMIMLIKETIRANQFAIPFAVNYQLVVRNNTGHVRVNLMINDQSLDVRNQSCSSFINQECKQQYYIDVYPPNCMNQGQRLTVDGFYVSFYPVESLLLSQLQCLYNTSFMHILGKTGCMTDYNKNFEALSQPSRFPINVTFLSLVNQLFIESWEPEFNYAAYFEQCQPQTCSYTVIEKPSLTSKITAMICLFGGLVILVRFLTPLIVGFILTCCHQQAHQEEPSETIQSQGKKDSKNTILMNPSDCW